MTTDHTHDQLCPHCVLEEITEALAAATFALEVARANVALLTEDLASQGDA